MAIKEWTTDYPTTQDADPIIGNQPELANESALGAGDGDATRVSQIHILRDKLQAVAKFIGDDGNLPADSLRGKTAISEPIMLWTGILFAKNDLLDDSVIDPMWTQSAGVGSIAETTELQMIVPPAATAIWTTALQSSPIVLTSLNEPRDFTITAHCTCDANNDTAGGLSIALGTDITQKQHIKLGRVGGVYQVWNELQNDAAGTTVPVGQDNAWLMIGRRGNSIITGFSLLPHTTEPPHAAYAFLHNLIELDWTASNHFGWVTAMAAYNWSTVPGCTIDFRKFRQSF